MIQTDVAVIGGGAAGLMAAIAAARRGAKTVIIEHMNRAGKKLLSTGNGKCNYTNALQGVSYYRGENPAFVLPVMEQFGFEETVSFFQELGIYPKPRNGYYYPASGQAASVLEVLLMEAEYQKVRIFTDCKINDIHKKRNRFFIGSDREEFSAKTVLFAPGLLAAQKTGSDGSVIPYIKKMGHHMIEIIPALVQLQGKQTFFKALAGIRTEVVITLYIEKQKALEETGELQLTEYGISGIPVFQLSRFAVRALAEGKKVYAGINFAPGMGEKELGELLRNRFFVQDHGKTAAEVLIGLFPKKMIGVLLKEAGIPLHIPARQAKKEQLLSLCKTVCQFRVDVTGSKGFDAAQVCAGGVDTTELDGITLESMLVPGVYFAGEVIDIDGACGGYNLQWAWSSGYVAGIHAAERALTETEACHDTH